MALGGHVVAIIITGIVTVIESDLYFVYSYWLKIMPILPGMK